MLCTVYIELPLVKQKFHILSSKMDVPNMISLKEMLRKLFKCLNCKINFLYPNRTHRHLKNPYNAHKYRLYRDLPLSLRTPTLHFFSKLTCKNFPFLLFRDTALFLLFSFCLFLSAMHTTPGSFQAYF